MNYIKAPFSIVGEEINRLSDSNNDTVHGRRLNGTYVSLEQQQIEYNDDVELETIRTSISSGTSPVANLEDHGSDELAGV